jgi:hypothetical protein
VDTPGACFAPAVAVGAATVVAGDDGLRTPTVQPVKPNCASLAAASVVAAALPKQLELRPLT